MAKDEKPPEKSGDKAQDAAPQGNSSAEAIARLEEKLVKQDEQIAQLLEVAKRQSVGLQEIDLPPLEDVALSHRPHVRDYLVTFKGPAADRVLQPIEVQAIGGPHAVARVVQATKIDAHKHVFETIGLGPKWIVKAKDEKKGGEDFPREVYVDTEEEAIQAAKKVTDAKFDLVAERA